MKRILFQGDSITDACRDREHLDNLGIGYPTLVKAELGFENPEKFDFQNRGISGNRIVDVYARIKSDIINLSPDYMSILIDVNDVWHEISYQNGIDAEKYQKIYCMMLDESFFFTSFAFSKVMSETFTPSTLRISSPYKPFLLSAAICSSILGLASSAKA